MILKKILDIKQSIEKQRKELLNIAKEKSLTDPDVLVMSSQLDQEIVTMQKLIDSIN